MAAERLEIGLQLRTTWHSLTHSLTHLPAPLRAPAFGTRSASSRSRRSTRRSTPRSSSVIKQLGPQGARAPAAARRGGRARARGGHALLGAPRRLRSHRRGESARGAGRGGASTARDGASALHLGLRPAASRIGCSFIAMLPLILSRRMMKACCGLVFPTTRPTQQSLWSLRPGSTREKRIIKNFGFEVCTQIPATSRGASRSGILPPLPQGPARRGCQAPAAAAAACQRVAPRRGPPSRDGTGHPRRRVICVLARSALYHPG